jgi:hypothetical protein
MPEGLRDPLGGEPGERRRARRFLPDTVRVEVDIDADPERLMLVDLSLSGFSVRSRRPFEVAALLHITFTIDRYLSLIVPARVVHCRTVPARMSKGPYFAGFEFVHDEQPDVERIVEILLQSISSVEAGQ